jgi:hypothetical protein
VNTPMVIPQPSDLENFIEFLFEGLEGYMYVVAKRPEHGDDCTDKLCKCWDQVFFEYPEQVPHAIRAINKFSPTTEIYLAPALFKSKQNAQKDNVKCTQVLWCDFDGNTPVDFDIPPSYIIRTSEPGHEHVYWKLDTPLMDVETIEDFNRRLTFKYAADNSGWDANQVLRPPYTTNHKRGSLSVTITKAQPDLSCNLSVFDDLAPAPEKSVDYSLWEKLDLPSLNDVIYRNRFGPDFKHLFEKQKAEVNDRSASLTNMAYICAEANLSDSEIYVVISHLADRWEKFKHHTPSSRARQLISIIEHTRIKYPHSNYNELDRVFEYSPKTLLETDIQVEWAIPNMLMKNGVMLLAGRSGIGKSQLSIQFMAHLAAGKDFLHYEVEKPQKIGFFSLEMGDMELKHLLQSMYPQWQQVFTPEELNLLNENLKLLPFGESLPLNSTHGQDILIQYLEAHQWDGIFVDSVGSAILGNISSSETVQAFTNFNDKVRKRYGCFLWYVHHFRKPASGTTHSGSQEDLFGDQYLTARATSVYTLTPAKSGLIRIRNPKNRHAAEESPYLIKRELGLTFSHQGIENEVPVTGVVEMLADNLTKTKKLTKAEQEKPENDFTPLPFMEP